MKAFRFRLEPLHTLRTWEEERARVALAQAAAQERRIAGALGAVESRIEEDLAAWRGESGGGSASARIARWRHLLHLERERTDVAAKLVSARRIREAKLKLVIEAHRRVGTLEKLRERQHHAHLAEMIRRDEREAEELFGARFHSRHETS